MFVFLSGYQAKRKSQESFISESSGARRFDLFRQPEHCQTRVTDGRKFFPRPVDPSFLRSFLKILKKSNITGNKLFGQLAFNWFSEIERFILSPEWNEWETRRDETRRYEARRKPRRSTLFSSRRWILLRRWRPRRCRRGYKGRTGGKNCEAFCRIFNKAGSEEED